MGWPGIALATQWLYKCLPKIQRFMKVRIDISNAQIFFLQNHRKQTIEKHGLKNAHLNCFLFLDTIVSIFYIYS